MTITRLQHYNGSVFKGMRQKARILVVVKGYSQKAASAEVGVSEKTMSKWAKEEKWKVADKRKLQARILIVMQGYSQKNACAEVGVSKKTMSKWAKEEKWKEKITDADKESVCIDILVNGFFTLLIGKYPTLDQSVSNLWEAYLERLGNGLWKTSE